MTPDPGDFDPDLGDRAAAAILVLVSAAFVYFLALAAGCAP